MKSRIVGRVVSLVVLSMLFSWAMHYNQTSRGQMGLEKYLAKQTERFNKHYAKPDPFILDLIGVMVIVVPFLCVYEGLAWAVSKTLKGMDEAGGS